MYYVLEGAKLIIVETWGGHVLHRQERDVHVIVSYAWGATGILGGHLPPTQSRNNTLFCAPMPKSSSSSVERTVD